MQPLNVIVAQSDCVAAEQLATSLKKHFRTIAIARDVGQIRGSILRIHADAVVLDLELLSLNEVRQLSKEFANVSLVCTHRVPDERMWTEAMENGAADFCARTDVNGVINAVCKNAQSAESARAA